MRSKSLATSDQFLSMLSLAPAAGRAHHVAPRQAVEAVARGQVADVHLVTLGRIVRRRCTSCSRRRGSRCRGPASGELVVPLPLTRAAAARAATRANLAHGRLGPLDALPAQFPVGVQPVGIADHDDEAVLARAHSLRRGDAGQVLGLGQLDLDLLQAMHRRGLRSFLAAAVAIAVAVVLLCRPAAPFTRALTNWSFRIMCQPATFFLRAMAARSLTVRVLSFAAVVTDRTSGLRLFAAILGRGRKHLGLRGINVSRSVIPIRW